MTPETFWFTNLLCRVADVGSAGDVIAVLSAVAEVDRALFGGAS